MRTLIAPSILSADFSRIGEQVKEIESAGADIVHCDVMDGVFVPNITFGIKMISDIKKITTLPLDVHLMIVEPQKYAERFIKAGADILSFHYEAIKEPRELLQFIRKCGAKSGIVISPDTDVNVLNDCLDVCDLVLLMSVCPGFGGQKFIENSYERLKELCIIAKKQNPQIMIEIDGGVTEDNIGKIVEAGAEVIVAGNTVFNAKDKKAVIDALRANKK